MIEEKWLEVEQTLTRTAQKLSTTIAFNNMSEIPMKELLHVGVLTIMLNGFEDADPAVQRTIAKRAMWDFIIRQHRVVTLPETGWARLKASRKLEGVVNYEDFRGYENPEPCYILGIDLLTKLKKMNDRPKQLWMYTLMGYNRGEIAALTGLSPSSVGTALSRDRLVPRSTKGLQAGEITYKQNRGSRNGNDKSHRSRVS